MDIQEAAKEKNANSIKLSILICALTSRVNLSKELFKNLYAQLGERNNDYYCGNDYEINTITSHKMPVELIVCMDNGQMTVGAKRNLLIKKAKGDYVCFIDDDDKVDIHYAQIILNSIVHCQNKESTPLPDVIVFDAIRFHNGEIDRLVKYGREFIKDNNTANCYYRIPNHLCPVKRELALKVKFKEVNFGEDSDYAKRLLPLLKNEFKIGLTLYWYMFNDKISATHGRR